MAKSKALFAHAAKVSAPVELSYQDLEHGISCIDTYYSRAAFAGCYLVRQGDEVAIIDAGTTLSTPAVMQLLEEKSISPEQVKYVIPTHVHLDHAGGTGALMAQMPNAQMVIHPRGAQHLINPEKIIQGTIAVYGEEAYKKLYGDIIPVPAERVIEADDGFSVEIDGRKLLCLHTLGHAKHHMCIWDETSRGFFTGDSFGISYRELDTDQGPFMFLPSTPIDFDPIGWHNTLDRLMSYEPENMYLTHFCHLPEPAKYAQRLHWLIDAYVDIALSASGKDRYQQIKAGLQKYYLEALRNHGNQLSKEEILDNILEMDIDLCAQGLEVWLKRREKAEKNRATS